MAQPARQREKAGKLYPPAIQRLVSLQAAPAVKREAEEDWGASTAHANERLVR
jgi:hypothetical protein